MRKSPEAPGTECRPPRHAPRRPHLRPGIVQVPFAVFLTAPDGVAAFAIDAGSVALDKALMQAAADDAALAGAQQAQVPPSETASADAVRAEVGKSVDLM